MELPVGKNSKPDSLKFKTGLSHAILNSRISKYIREGKKMTEQIHKRLANDLVRTVLERYVKKELDVEQTMDLLGLKRSQLFKRSVMEEIPAGGISPYDNRQG